MKFQKMFKSKIILSIFFLLLLSSCSNTFDSVKRGLTGEKQLSTDEFLVRKKDPLILPPDYGLLPDPSNQEELGSIEEINIEKTLQKSVSDLSSSQDSSTTSSSTEESILKQIRKK
tara:strand:+ start:834 stop:1181 length:348 start_codon:yes stop_codon:yes gene_type:complete